jgi:hypothetical protein
MNMFQMSCSYPAANASWNLDRPGNLCELQQAPASAVTITFGSCDVAKIPLLCLCCEAWRGVAKHEGFVCAVLQSSLLGSVGANAW